MKRAVVFLAVCAIALAANAVWVALETRPAAPRDGGAIFDTAVVPANVRIEGSGPTILLLHGFGAAIDWWDEIAPALAADHRVVRLDLIGHGGTEAPRTGYMIVRQAELASAILDKLGVERVTVIAHSMGGEVATALADRKPERIERMILIDSPPTAGTTFTMLTEAYLAPGLGELLSHFRSDAAIRRGLAQGFAPNFPVPEKFVADLKQLTYEAFRTAHDESIAFRKAKAPYERLAALEHGSAAARDLRRRGRDRAAGPREALGESAGRPRRNDPGIGTFPDGRGAGEDARADPRVPAAGSRGAVGAGLAPARFRETPADAGGRKGRPYDTIRGSIPAQKNPLPPRGRGKGEGVRAPQECRTMGGPADDGGKRSSWMETLSRCSRVSRATMTTTASATMPRKIQSLGFCSRAGSSTGAGGQ